MSDGGLPKVPQERSDEDNFGKPLDALDETWLRRFPAMSHPMKAANATRRAGAARAFQQVVGKQRSAEVLETLRSASGPGRKRFGRLGRGAGERSIKTQPVMW